MIVLACDLAELAGAHRDLLARGDRSQATGAMVAAGLCALRVATAPTVTALEHRLKLELLKCHVLPATRAVGHRDVARIVEILLIDAPLGRFERRAVGTTIDKGVTAARSGSGRGGNVRTSAPSPDRHRDLAALYGRSEELVHPIMEVSNDLKALRSKDRSLVIEGAIDSLEILALTLCALPTTEAEEAIDKVAVLDEIVPDLRSIDRSLARVAVASVTVERERWPQVHASADFISANDDA